MFWFPKRNSPLSSGNSVPFNGRRSHICGTGLAISAPSWNPKQRKGSEKESSWVSGRFGGYSFVVHHLLTH